MFGMGACIDWSPSTIGCGFVKILIARIRLIRLLLVLRFIRTPELGPHRVLPGYSHLYVSVAGPA